MKMTSEQEARVLGIIRTTLDNTHVGKGYGGMAGGVEEFMSRWEDDGTLFVDAKVDNLKVGGADDIDSNDGTAESELRKAVMTALSNKVPNGWKVECGGGEKGWMPFYVVPVQKEKP